MGFPGFIAKKVGMTQVFNEDGSATPVTVLQLIETTVTQVKSEASDGYDAIQVGYESAKAKHLTKAQQGHLVKSNLKLFRRLKEFRVKPQDMSDLSVGAVLSYEFIEVGQAYKVTGKSIGKGTMGNIRRWGHHRGPMSHGSKSHRLPGSIGAGTTPGRVFKGLQMAGRTGNERVTVSNLKVVKIMREHGLVLIKGSVPGVEGGYITAVRQK
jgi:large subunit ribosomal protein L3